MLHLGFFPDFKSLDAVLLAADSAGIRAIQDALSRAIATPSQTLAIHDVAHVAQRQTARLFLTTATPDPGVMLPNAYYWVVSRNEATTVARLLERLRSVVHGHQYFDSTPGDVSLIVSVGECDTAWWEQLNT